MEEDPIRIFGCRVGLRSCLQCLDRQVRVAVVGGSRWTRRPERSYGVQTQRLLLPAGPVQHLFRVAAAAAIVIHEYGQLPQLPQSDCLSPGSARARPIEGHLPIGISDQHRRFSSHHIKEHLSL